MLDTTPDDGLVIAEIVKCFEIARNDGIGSYHTIDYVINELLPLEETPSNGFGNPNPIWITLLRNISGQLSRLNMAMDSQPTASITSGQFLDVLVKISLFSSLKRAVFIQMDLQDEECLSSATIPKTTRKIAQVFKRFANRPRISPNTRFHGPKILFWPSEAIASFMCVSKTFLASFFRAVLGSGAMEDIWIGSPASDSEINVNVSYQLCATNRSLQTVVFPAHAYVSTIDHLLTKALMVTIHTAYPTSVLPHIRLGGRAFNHLNIKIYDIELFGCDMPLEGLKLFLTPNRFKTITIDFVHSFSMAPCVVQCVISWILPVCKKRVRVIWPEPRSYSVSNSELVAGVQKWMTKQKIRGKLTMMVRHMKCILVWEN
ncbi:hypothetical protein NEDG_02111 [Nematocida displodere]|uniref:Uncharacterized protein n=1 Tax=Nematocida displodere TaxID=1805483 RepID=A0A177EM55_9MICR|nr:hypothetical protein NEDG_02111 [Nematocida displodere]